MKQETDRLTWKEMSPDQRRMTARLNNNRDRIVKEMNELLRKYKLDMQIARFELAPLGEPLVKLWPPISRELSETEPWELAKGEGCCCCPSGNLSCPCTC